MNLWRIVYIYFIFGSLTIFFLYIAYKIYKRDSENKISKILVSFYHLIAAAFMINLVYASLRHPAFQTLVNFLNLLTIFLICFAMGFLVLFSLSIGFPIYMKTQIRKILFIIFHFSLCSGLFFIPEGVQVTILKDGTQTFPVWSLPFALYAFLIFFFSLLVTVIFSIRAHNKFNHQVLAKRMKYFIIGTLFMSYLGIAACVFNYLDISYLRILNTIVTFILIFPGSVFLYLGLGEDFRTSI